MRTTTMRPVPTTSSRCRKTAARFSGASLRLQSPSQTHTDSFRIMPRVLVDVSRVDTGVTVLGQALASPICIAPSAMQRMAHPEGELATARAALGSSTGTHACNRTGPHHRRAAMVLSSWSTTSLEHVAQGRAGCAADVLHCWQRMGRGCAGSSCMCTRTATSCAAWCSGPRRPGTAPSPSPSTPPSSAAGTCVSRTFFVQRTQAGRRAQQVQAAAAPDLGQL